MYVARRARGLGETKEVGVGFKVEYYDMYIMLYISPRVSLFVPFAH